MWKKNEGLGVEGDHECWKHMLLCLSFNLEMETWTRHFTEPCPFINPALH